MLSGKTTLIAHIGYPTTTFKSPMIYNPWFEKHEIDACVVPMGVKVEDYPTALRTIFNFTNVLGALITMPHKVTTMGLVDECTITARIAGAANAVIKRADGTLLADMFDGAGFTRAVKRHGFTLPGATCLVVGSGGVGSAIAASLAAEHVSSIALCDTHEAAARALADRLTTHYPNLEVKLATSDPAGYGLVVNATPLGMKPEDPLPFDTNRLDPTCYVGEVVLKNEITPMLERAKDRGCRFSVGTDMLFEMIPAYLEFFGLGTSTPDELRSVAKIKY